MDPSEPQASRYATLRSFEGPWPKVATGDDVDLVAGPQVAEKQLSLPARRLKAIAKRTA